MGKQKYNLMQAQLWWGRSLKCELYFSWRRTRVADDSLSRSPPHTLLQDNWKPKGPGESWVVNIPPGKGDGFEYGRHMLLLIVFLRIAAGLILAICSYTLLLDHFSINLTNRSSWLHIYAVFPFADSQILNVTNSSIWLCHCTLPCSSALPSVKQE